MTDKIREEMAKIIAGSRDETCNGCGSMVEADNPETTVTQILSIKGIRIEAENQELPEPSNDIAPNYFEETLERKICIAYGKRVIEEGWVKCLKKEEQ